MQKSTVERRAEDTFPGADAVSTSHQQRNVVQPKDVTAALQRVMDGDPAASEDLLPLVYSELRRLANHYMAKERAGHTLQPTALVHDAYLRLIDRPDGSWEGRRHFFNAAAQVMRHQLMDHGRRRAAIRHGGNARREVLDGIDMPVTKDVPVEQWEGLDRAMDELRAHNARWAEVACLRYFIGLTIAQTADLLGVSVATVKNDWQFARAWLRTRAELLSPETSV